MLTNIATRKNIINTYLSRALTSKRPSTLLMAKNVSFGKGLVKMSAS